jgi:hypothetical protein
MSNKTKLSDDHPLLLAIAFTIAFIWCEALEIMAVAALTK